MGKMGKETGQEDGLVGLAVEGKILYHQGGGDIQSLPGMVEGKRVASAPSLLSKRGGKPKKREKVHGE